MSYVFYPLCRARKNPRYTRPIGIPAFFRTGPGRRVSQFTTLTTDPSFLGFLCFALNDLATAHRAEFRQDFNRSFRTLETFWGLLHVLNNRTIVNVTRYSGLVSRGALTRDSLEPDYVGLFQRYNYGVWGRYAVPAIIWGLYNRERQCLTEQGLRLAKAWEEREGCSFGQLAERWWGGARANSLDVAGRRFLQGTTPSSEERGVWQELVTSFLGRLPALAPLWAETLPASVLDYNPASCSSLVAITENYAQVPTLGKRFADMLLVSRIFAAVRFVFEWEYLRLSDAEWPGKPERADEVARHLQNLCAAFVRDSAIPSARDWQTAERLAACGTWEAARDCIVAHHIANQRRKGSIPFMENVAVCLQHKVDQATPAAVGDALAASPGRDLDEIFFEAYPHDWFFRQLVTWRRHAGTME